MTEDDFSDLPETGDQVIQFVLCGCSSKWILNSHITYYNLQLQDLCNKKMHIEQGAL